MKRHRNEFIKHDITYCNFPCEFVANLKGEGKQILFVREETKPRVCRLLSDMRCGGQNVGISITSLPPAESERKEATTSHH